jgi:hypothetical protein
LFVPFEHQVKVLAIVLAVVLLGSAVLVLGLRRTNENAFFATGMLLSLVPVCATWPSDRLLIFAGFGAFGLVGDFLTAPRDGLSLSRRVAVRVAAVFFVLLHIVLAPLLFTGRAVQISQFLHEPLERAAASYPPAAELAGKTLIIVNAPDFLVPSFGLMVRTRRGELMPDRFRQLAIAVQGRVRMRRTGARTLEMTLTKGFFHDPFSLVFRRAEPPMALGERVEIAGMTATVKGHTADGKKVATVEFELDRPLDDPSCVWVTWVETRMERFRVPAVGEEIELQAADYQKAMQGS